MTVHTICGRKYYSNSDLLGLNYKIAKKFKRKAIGFFKFKVTKTLDELAHIIMNINNSDPNTIYQVNKEEAKEFARGMNGNGFQYSPFGACFVVERVPKKDCEEYYLTKGNCYG
jgi:hypothetical protein